MKELQVGLYARASSKQQTEAKTIESQVAEIQTRSTADGFALKQVLGFLNDAMLIRPS